MIFVQVILAVVWFSCGVSGPLVTNINCGKWTAEDAFMIPLSGLLGPFGLATFLCAYHRQKN